MVAVVVDIENAPKSREAMVVGFVEVFGTEVRFLGSRQLLRPDPW